MEFSLKDECAALTAGLKNPLLDISGECSAQIFLEDGKNHLKAPLIAKTAGQVEVRVGTVLDTKKNELTINLGGRLSDQSYLGLGGSTVQRGSVLISVQWIHNLEHSENTNKKSVFASVDCKKR